MKDVQDSGRRYIVAAAFLAIGVSPAWGATAAPGPSFSCARASGWVETTICGEAALAAADARLASVFTEAKGEAGAKAAALVTVQRDWLKGREACRQEADPVSCLASAYGARTQELVSGLPVLGRARLPLSSAAAERLLAVFGLMTPEDLNAATSNENREALSAASCLYFQRSPHAAAVLFAAFAYSSRDAWTPLCGTLDVAQQVPATQPLLAVLETIEGAPQSLRCQGTMRYGVLRSQAVLRILAVVDPAPDVAAYDKEHAPAASDAAYRPDVAHWGVQGLWEKRQYAELQHAIERARPALSADYARRFHLDAARAGRLAEFNVRRLIDAYTGAAGESSTTWYSSLCLTPADLDAYLKTGRMPAECPHAEDVEHSPPATLRRLLGLAIVNNYPLAAIQRLLAAGAQLDPRAKQDDPEPKESPLMLAAARSDVIDALLAAGADVNRGNDFGKTALMYAVQERNLDGVRRLLHGGAHVDAATAEDLDCTALLAGRRTALMYAAWQGTPIIVQLLLHANANAALLDTAGKTAAAYVAKNTALSAADRQAMEKLLKVPGVPAPAPPL